MATRGVRIPENVFKIVSSLFFGFAILGAVSRTIIRWRSHRCLHPDDWLLFAACICLVAATILVHKTIPSIYFFQTLFSDPSSFKIPEDIVERINWFHNANNAYLVVTWTAIFSVKFSFLLFFRRLIDRLGKRIVTYWKATILVNIIAFFYCAFDAFIACPKHGLEAISCTQGAGLTKVITLGVLSACLDIATEIMIVAIPIWIVWKVKIKPRQKLGLAAFLCLNICLAIIACVRISGIHSKGTFDQTWNFFWQQMEVTIAIVLVSLTAFRQVFVSDKSKVQAGRAKRWHSSPIIPLLRGSKKHSVQDENPGNLPSIPSATLTGMRTYIQGGKGMFMLESEAYDSYSQHAVAPRQT